MRIHITSTRLLSDIQKEFNQMFPFLKIEFYNTKLFSRTRFSVQQLVSQHHIIGDLQLVVRDGEIEISEEMKVSELERIFNEDFGLAVQVFRKVGNLWLETSMTNKWTLQKQNNYGRELSVDKALFHKPGGYGLNWGVHL